MARSQGIHIWLERKTQVIAATIFAVLLAKSDAGTIASAMARLWEGMKMVARKDCKSREAVTPEVAAPDSSTMATSNTAAPEILTAIGSGEDLIPDACLVAKALTNSVKKMVTAESLSPELRGGIWYNGRSADEGLHGTAQHIECGDGPKRPC
mmetsp:Transcript_37812/g.76930  ORF Transcript_37812/g.76930 Transcript_37812/m.76930 type:complete len:153 (-) Transcript_37812:30-488(-)